MNKPQDFLNAVVIVLCFILELATKTQHPNDLEQYLNTHAQNHRQWEMAIGIFATYQDIE